MCDTIGRIISKDLAIFAKNSDRSPNEAQVIEFIEHKHHDEAVLISASIRSKKPMPWSSPDRYGFGEPRWA